MSANSLNPFHPFITKTKTRNIFSINPFLDNIKDFSSFNSNNTFKSKKRPTKYLKLSDDDDQQYFNEKIDAPFQKGNIDNNKILIGFNKKKESKKKKNNININIYINYSNNKGDKLLQEKSEIKRNINPFIYYKREERINSNFDFNNTNNFPDPPNPFSDICSLFENMNLNENIINIMDRKIFTNDGKTPGDN